MSRRRINRWSWVIGSSFFFSPACPHRCCRCCGRYLPPTCCTLLYLPIPHLPASPTCTTPTPAPTTRYYYTCYLPSYTCPRLLPAIPARLPQRQPTCPPHYLQPTYLLPAMPAPPAACLALPPPCRLAALLPRCLAACCLAPPCLALPACLDPLWSHIRPSEYGQGAGFALALTDLWRQRV